MISWTPMPIILMWTSGTMPPLRMKILVQHTTCCAYHVQWIWYAIKVICTLINLFPLTQKTLQSLYSFSFKIWNYPLFSLDFASLTSTVVEFHFCLLFVCFYLPYFLSVYHPHQSMTNWYAFLSSQVSNAYLQAFRPGSKMVFEFVKEMPKYRTKTKVDIASLLGTLFFTWVIIQLFPVSIRFIACQL